MIACKMRSEAAEARSLFAKLWQEGDHAQIQGMTVENFPIGTERVNAPQRINPVGRAARESAKHHQTQMA